MDTRTRTRFALCVMGVAALHFTASVMLAFTGGISGGLSAVLANILLFPLNLLRGPDDARLGWLVWAMISLFWGLGVCTLIYYVRRTKA